MKRSLMQMPPAPTGRVGAARACGLLGPCGAITSSNGAVGLHADGLAVDVQNPSFTWTRVARQADHPLDEVAGR